MAEETAFFEYQSKSIEDGLQRKLRCLPRCSPGAVEPRTIANRVLAGPDAGFI